jgi:NitT/TauT family transport system permease protein
VSAGLLNPVRLNPVRPKPVRRVGRPVARLHRAAKRSVVLLTFLALWEILPRTVVEPGYLPPFSVVVRAAIGLFVSGEIWEHLSISLSRSLMGFALAVLVGVPLGLLIGWFREVEEYVDPFVQTLRQTPVLALLPVFILFLGIGEASKVAIIFWGTVWPILLSTISGVKEVDPVVIASARSMGARRLDLFRRVVLPATVPSIMTGIRLGATFAILMLVVAEYVGAKAGIGALVINSQYAFQIPKMYAAILILALLGLSTNAVLVRLQRRATRWKES